jgi:hypothetical protein
MTMIRNGQDSPLQPVPVVLAVDPVPIPGQVEPDEPSLEQTVRAWHEAGRRQRAIARELHIDRRKVKRIIHPAA